jgi:hypothetical protein
MDERNVTRDISQLLIVIPDITESFDKVEEVTGLKCLRGITKGEDFFLSGCETMKELGLSWTKIRR